MQSLSKDAIIATVQELLGQGVPPSKIASNIPVSKTSLVEALIYGQSDKCRAVLTSGVGSPITVTASTDYIQVDIGSEPRWALSVHVSGPNPAVRSLAPYTDVSIEMREEDLVAYQSTTAYPAQNEE